MSKYVLDHEAVPIATQPVKVDEHRERVADATILDL